VLAQLQQEGCRYKPATTDSAFFTLNR